MMDEIKYYYRIGDKSSELFDSEKECMDQAKLIKGEKKAYLYQAMIYRERVDKTELKGEIK